MGHGGAAPRVLSIDSYFLTEVERVEKDPDSGRRLKKKVEEFEYDEAMEPAYRASLFKLFNKTLDEGFFPMIVVDAVNHKVSRGCACMQLKVVCHSLRMHMHI